MNKEVKRIFSDIHGEFANYQTAIASVLSAYRRDLEAAKRTAAQYKDEAGELSRRKEGLIAAARSKVSEADKALHDAVMMIYLPKLREALSDYVCKRADRDYMDSLRDVWDFNLSLSRAELAGYILGADGNYTALRALQAVAKRSGYRLTVPSADNYQGDIDRIERAVRVPVMYAPHDYLHEALEVLPDRPVFRADGSYYTTGRPDSVYLIMRKQEFESAMNAVTEAGTRWSMDFVPEITAFEPVKTDDGGEITPEQQRAEAVKDAAQRVSVDDTTAEQLTQHVTQEQAEADRRAAEGRKFYF